jgi:hypothetical protein
MVNQIDNSTARPVALRHYRTIGRSLGYCSFLLPCARSESVSQSMIWREAVVGGGEGSVDGGGARRLC